jgi:hypothetical protein
LAVKLVIGSGAPTLQGVTLTAGVGVEPVGDGRVGPGEQDITAATTAASERNRHRTINALRSFAFIAQSPTSDAIAARTRASPPAEAAATRKAAAGGVIPCACVALAKMQDATRTRQKMSSASVLVCGQDHTAADAGPDARGSGIAWAVPVPFFCANMFE